jgi:hypothetical protein
MYSQPAVGCCFKRPDEVLGRVPLALASKRPRFELGQPMYSAPTVRRVASCQADEMLDQSFRIVGCTPNRQSACFTDNRSPGWNRTSNFGLIRTALSPLSYRAKRGGLGKSASILTPVPKPHGFVAQIRTRCDEPRNEPATNPQRIVQRIRDAASKEPTKCWPENPLSRSDALPTELHHPLRNEDGIRTRGPQIQMYSEPAVGHGSTHVCFLSGERHIIPGCPGCAWKILRSHG